MHENNTTYATQAQQGGETITVGMGDMKVSPKADSALVTHALGSCIAVIVYDPIQKKGGMIHYMLPISKRSPERAATQPAMFADVGVPKLFEAMYAMGCKKKDLVVKVAGGASINQDGEMFQIGKRNFAVLRKMFWQNQILMTAQDVGGSHYRTARLDIESGRVTIKTRLGEKTL